jgi:hypothetical protein
MQNHQEFIRNFISPETPYNGALLFHGTGVGKTCASIGTSEGLRDYVHKNGKKIYILSSKNIRPNFYKELYDPDREKVEHDIHAVPGSYQCSGDRYYMDGYFKPGTKASAVKDMIKEYYNFQGFGQFANFVDIHLGGKLPPGMSPKITMEDGQPIDIGDYFSNSVIVIDEAHGIAGENKAVDDDMDDAPPVKKKSKKKTKKTKDAPRNVTKRSLFQVLVDTIIPLCRAKGGNLKILLLTATPMKDDVRELGNLLKLLNDNDGRVMEDRWMEKLFPAGMMKYTDISKAFSKEQEAMLAKYARGYISYVKGDIPVTFPKAILPPGEQLYEPGKRFGPEINPIYSYNRDEGDIRDKYDITNPRDFRFNLVECPMNWYQFTCYQVLISRNMPNARLSSDTSPRMLSNIAYPVVGTSAGKPFTPYMAIDKPDELIDHLKGNDVGGGAKTRSVYGNNGFEYVFRLNPNKVTYSMYEPIWQQCGFFMMIDKNLGLDEKYSKDYTLDIFSKKLDMLVRNINTSPGIAYVYSEFVNTGAMVCALTLESNGYARYHPNLKQYIDKETGLPKRALLNANLPECFLLTLNNEQLQRLPQNHYRCSTCGKLYTQCRKDNPTAARPGHHKFNLATYVVITGSLGGVKEISEVVTDNKLGDKIKVVIGTKVTGTGVDFKWVRQVHILDPWHNNTRIFQAIGRGLRHCSHADLPEVDRTVQIFKYVSTTNVEPIHRLLDAEEIDLENEEDLSAKVNDDGTELSFTYKDLLTETVDEHMYRRVVRKDLIIKVIERVLKRIAVDCEFNRNRNMFPGAEDYSRECDYMECSYTCDGFQNPIQYIRRIRMYEDGTFSYIDGAKEETMLGDKDGTALSELIEGSASASTSTSTSNGDIWDRYAKSSKMLEAEAEADADSEHYRELLVDIPIPGPDGGQDNSTYNIHFSAPQIDKAMKLISRLFQKTQALKLDKIVHLVRKLNPLLEDVFVYSALDKIVGNPPYVKPMIMIDKYGRKGKIIVHNKIYIYQPLELEDLRIPMSYRSRPLTIKSRYYNMEKLTSKQAKKINNKRAHVNPEEVERLQTYLESLTIDSVAGIVKLHLTLHDTLIGVISALLETMVEASAGSGGAAGTNPENVQYLVEYCLLSGVAFFLPYNNKTDKALSITDLLDQCHKKKRHLLHIMDSTTQSGTNIKVYSGVSWTKQSIDNLPKGARFMDYDESLRDAKPDNRYPHSDMTVHMAATRKLLTDINDKSTPYIGKHGVYGLMSKPIPRTSQPIFQHSSLRGLLLGAVEAYNLEYPNITQLNKIKFKVFDQNQREITMTKSQEISKRGEIKGKVCMNGDEQGAHNLVAYLSEVIQNPDNFKIVSRGSLGPAEFMRELGINGKINEATGHFIPSRSNKRSACDYLKKLLIVASYFSLNDVKWFLNPIDTAIYRPKSRK